MLLIPTLLCPKSWEGMSGNDSQRFCSYCKKHVHNLENLSVQERLALLSSPAATICSRYRVAIRRAVRGKEDAYMRNLMSCGAAVAVTSSVLLVFWEMYDQDHRPAHYRVGSIHRHGNSIPMPADCYEDHEVVLLGMIAMPTPSRIVDGLTKVEPIDHIEVKLDPVEIDRLIEQAKPTNPPQIE